MAFSKNSSLPVAEYVAIASNVTTTLIGGVIQTFTVAGAQTSDYVTTQIVGDGTPLTLPGSMGARVSATDTVELTLSAALALSVRVRVWRTP